MNINIEKLSFPKRVTIEFTNDCNLKCVMCPRNKVNFEKSYLDEKIFDKIINELSNYEDLAIVPFFRGESLLHKNFEKYIKKLKELKRSKIQLFTNGVLLNQKIADFLVETKVDFISISLDAINKNVYKEIRGFDFFEKIIENINYLLKIKKEKKSLIEIQISLVKIDKNIDEIDEFVNFWKNKVDRVRIYEEHTKDDKLGKLEDTKEIKKRKPCKKPFEEIVIYANGDVAICNHDWERKDKIGNLKDNSIINIWNSEIYNEIRKKHLKNSFKENDICKFCDHWKAYYNEKHLIGELYKNE
jgi:radical SAM protein with 4Fe4S-binding SPASM domain